MRKRYVRVQLPEEIIDYVAYIVTNRMLGYRSMIEFVTSAVRKEVQRLRELQFIPPTVPKVKQIPVGAIGALTIILLLAGLFGISQLVPSSVTGLSVWGDIFQPLAGWNISSTYAKYSGFINILLYFVFFFAILFSTTKRWLERKEAIAISSVLSVVFSLGLAMIPINLLYQVSPIALFVIALVLMFVVFEALKQFGFKGISSSSLAYVLAYLLLRTHRPDAFIVAGTFGDILNFGFFITFAIVIIKAVKEFLTKSDSGFEHLKHTVKLGLQQAFTTEEDKKVLAREQEEILEILQIEPKEYKRITQFQKDLDKTEEAITRYSYNRDALALIAHELKKILGQESELIKDIEDLDELAKKLRGLDVALFAKLKEKYAKLSQDEQTLLKDNMKEKIAQLNLENILPLLAQSARETHEQIDTAIRQTIIHLEGNQPHDATKELDRARYYTNQLKNITNKVQDTTTAIHALTNKSLTYFKK